MKKALVGFGGHAREVMSQLGMKLTCFVDDDYVVAGTLPLSQFNPNEYELMIAVANSKDRYEIVKRLPTQTKFWSFIHPSSKIMDNNIKIGDGSFIGTNCILTTNITLGKHTLLNRGNHIGHDTIAGDYFSMMPCSVVGGNVNIGNNVYMGSCSNVREKINICDDVVIGMNSGVIKDIHNSGTYIGTPCHRMGG
jgi:sugar O-acyltransferase (sialic acid O-acetyltransferase NeuD family)